MSNFDPLAIMEKVNRMSDAEIKRENDEWRALYGELDPFSVAPFIEYDGAPLSPEGRRLALLVKRARHGRLPITRDIRFEVVHFLGAMVLCRRYDVALHRQKLVALLDRYERQVRKRRGNVGRHL
jgi:hypothetical protein